MHIPTRKRLIERYAMIRRIAFAPTSEAQRCLVTAEMTSIETELGLSGTTILAERAENFRIQAEQEQNRIKWGSCFEPSMFCDVGAL